MKWPRFAVATTVVVLAINAAPLLQLCKTGGLLYYRNGDAEPAYLQHDFSVRTQALSRFGQWPVSRLHEAGFSGGWINFAFDLSLPPAFLLLTRAIGRALALEERASLLFSLLAALGPLLGNGANPLIRELYNRAQAAGVIPWLALSDAAFLPLARTPEPQLSLVLLAGAALIAVRRRSLWPVCVVLPFLYTFLALPTGFVVLAMAARPLLRRFAGGIPEAAQVGAACALAWAALSAGAAVMLAIAVPPALKEFLVESHTPTLSLNGGLTLAAFALLRRSIREDLREFAMIAALAPLAAVNIQVIMGFLVSPISVELYGGAQCLSIVLGLGLAATAGPFRPGRRAAPLVVATAALFAMTSIRAAVAAWRTPVIEAPVLDALRRDASRVAVSDGNVARLLSLVLPLQARTALDYNQTYPQADPDQSFPRYLGDRAAILADPVRRGEFQGLLDALDRGYAHHNEDQMITTSGRARRYSANVDVPAEAVRFPGRSLDLVFVAVRNGRVVLDP